LTEAQTQYARNRKYVDSLFVPSGLLFTKEEDDAFVARFMKASQGNVSCMLDHVVNSEATQIYQRGNERELRLLMCGIDEGLSLEDIRRIHRGGRVSAGTDTLTSVSVPAAEVSVVRKFCERVVECDEIVSVADDEDGDAIAEWIRNGGIRGDAKSSLVRLCLVISQ